MRENIAVIKNPTMANNPDKSDPLLFLLRPIERPHKKITFPVSRYSMTMHRQYRLVGPLISDRTQDIPCRRIFKDNFSAAGKFDGHICPQDQRSSSRSSLPPVSGGDLSTAPPQRKPTGMIFTRARVHHLRLSSISSLSLISARVSGPRLLRISYSCLHSVRVSVPPSLVRSWNDSSSLISSFSLGVSSDSGTFFNDRFLYFAPFFGPLPTRYPPLIFAPHF